jgi:hypothetical protein
MEVNSLIEIISLQLSLVNTNLHYEEQPSAIELMQKSLIS